MSAYIVSFKATAPDSEIQSAKDNIQAIGGAITQLYPIIRGFSFAIPGDTAIVSTLESNEHVEGIEPESTVTTQ